MRSRALRAVSQALGVATLVVAIILLLTQGVGRPVTWQIPEAYRGWILLRYGAESCAPLKLDGLFEVIQVGSDGRGCTSSDLPRGWRYVRYEYVGPNGSSAIDGRLVVHYGVNDEKRQKTLFIGPGELDPSALPPEWR